MSHFTGRTRALMGFFCLATACGPTGATTNDGGADGAADAAPGPAGTGSIAVSIWGEDYIPQGIPAQNGSSAGFENGWTLRYTKFLVNIGDVRVARSAGAPETRDEAMRVFDLVNAREPLAIRTLTGVEATRLGLASYRLAPATMQSIAGNASATDLQRMQSQGLSVYFEATATHPTRGMFTFAWGFTNHTQFTSCRSPDDLPGLVVPTNGTADFQITVHADHPWYDDLQSPDASMRFDAYADADRNSDRVITLDELAAVDLTSLPTGQYGTGSARGVNTLRDFITHLIDTVGHFNGEGHCEELRM